MADQPPAYNSAQYDSGPDGGEEGEGTRSKSDGGAVSGPGGMQIEVSYFRSLEGVLRIVAIICAVIGGILIIADIFRSAGGWFFFLGFWFIVYNVIVIVIETCIPNVSMHKLIDAIILFAYAALWILSSILNISFAIAIGDALLGVASIFGAACAVICIVLGVFAIRTWQTKGESRTGAMILF